MIKKQEQERWGVVGGGVLGMTAALRLARQGMKVTLFEAAPNIGGLTSAWQLDDITWDKFYHVILMSDKYTRGMLKELDLDEEMKWVETKTGFYTNGNLYSMSNSIEFLKFPPLSLFDKFRLGFTIFYASRIKNWKKLEQKYVADWLKRFSGKNTFEKMWLPLLRSKLGDSYVKTSAAFIWATIQRMYAARRSGLKKEMFGYIPGGYARILSEFEKLLIREGVDIQTGFKAKSINALENNKLELEFTSGLFYNADKVIVTIPSAFVPGICKGIPKQELEKHKAINYLGVVCASILLKKPISSFYVTNITDQGIPFTGVIEMTALVDKSELGNKNLIYLPKYILPNDPIFNESDDSIIDRFENALLEMYPKLSKDDFCFAGIARAKNVFALSTLNYSENLPPKKTGVKNLYVINSAHITNGTLNVNETIKLAEESILEITSSL